MAAGYVFFGVVGVDFVIGFIAFGGDGVKANAVNRSGGRTQLRHRYAKFVPGKIDEIEKNAESEDGQEKAAGGKSGGVGWSGRG